MTKTNTIFAISSGKVKSGVVVFRISGPEAFKVIEIFQLLEFKPDFRKCYVRQLVYKDQIIDKVLMIFFKGPNSFTGEDCVEIHAHGSLAIMSILSKILSKYFKLAAPGEFTKRAFANDKLSLHEVDGISDMLSASTYAQHDLAIKQINGELYRIHESWRDNLVQTLAYIEACLDFPEEEIPKQIINIISQNISAAKHSFELAIKNFFFVQKIKDGVKVAILGKPNAGKSSLINKISNREIAIVSEISGTTRDLLETHVEISGHQLNIIDTAGIKGNSADKIEQIGIKLAKEAAKTSDIQILLISIEDLPRIMNQAENHHSQIETSIEGSKIHLHEVLDVILNSNDELFQYIRENILHKNSDSIEVRNLDNVEEMKNLNSPNTASAQLNQKMINPGLIIAINKIDLINEASLLDNNACNYSLDTDNQSSKNSQRNIESNSDFRNVVSLVPISIISNLNIDLLIREIELKCDLLTPRDNIMIANLRQKQHIEEALDCLCEICVDQISEKDLIFISESVRGAIFALEKLIGKVTPEEILGKIFSEFCIGK